MNTSDNSWIKLPRTFCDWRWYKDSQMVQLYLYLLINANMQSTEYRNTVIKRGEFMTSLRSLTVETGITIKTIRTCLSRLKRTKEIQLKKMNKYGTIIILTEYDKFQPIGIDENASNWIKLYRKMINWHWYMDSQIVHLYVHCLLKGSLVYVPTIDRYVCQFETNRCQLHRETNISIQSIKTCIKKLTSTKEISFEKKSTTKNSLVTICERDDYELLKNAMGTERAQNGHRRGTVTSLPSYIEQKSTTKNSNVNISTTDSYEPLKNAMGTEGAQKGHRKGTEGTQKGHEKGTYNKNIRIKDNLSSTSACAYARGEEKVDRNFEEGEKENLQKKARKESFSRLLLENSEWIEAMKRSFGFTEEQLRNKISDFECDLLCRGKGPHKDQQDYMGHLCDWLSKNRLKTQQSSKPIKRQSNNAISKRQQELEARIRTPRDDKDDPFGGVF